MSIRSLLIGVLLSCPVLGACGGSDAVDIGTTTVGTRTFLISYEGPAPTAGVMTNFVIKPTAGGNPDSVSAWIGSAGGTGPKVPGVYDPNDGDYDNEQTVPSPLTPDDLYCFDVTADGTTMTGTIAFQGK